MTHKPVLLNEIIEYLNPEDGKIFVDGTANGGGHTMAITERIVPSGKMISVEWDKEIYANLQEKIQKSEFKNNIIAVNDNYANLKNILEELKIERIDGILLDLGFSSVHVDVSGRGFSFKKNEPLDMRYHTTEGNITAAEILSSYTEKDLADIIYKFGEERFARNIANNIVEARRKKRIITTFDLVDVIRGSVPESYRRGGIDCATRTFQALRIQVNGELDNVEKVLPQMIDVLRSGGRIAIISFHSLEDRIVKNFFRDRHKEGLLKIITKKPVVATREEVMDNPRSRSAKLRIAEKI